GIRVRLMLHRNMQFWWNDVARRHGAELGEFVDLLPPDAQIHDEIASARLLVTDYSSVAWDFLYMKRPVVFYMFDVEEYLARQGSYIAIPDELFGAFATTAHEAVESIIECWEKPDP